MWLELIHENEDGSADFTLNITEEEKQHLVRYGLLEAIKRGIEAGEELNPEFVPDPTGDQLEIFPEARSE